MSGENETRGEGAGRLAGEPLSELAAKEGIKVHGVQGVCPGEGAACAKALGRAVSLVR